MPAQYDAWMKSSHHSVAACNDCDAPRNIVGKYAVKANNGVPAFVLLHHGPASLARAREYQRKGQFIIDFVHARELDGLPCSAGGAKNSGGRRLICADSGSRPAWRAAAQPQSAEHSERGLGERTRG